MSIHTFVKITGEQNMLKEFRDLFYLGKKEYEFKTGEIAENHFFTCEKIMPVPSLFKSKEEIINFKSNFWGLEDDLNDHLTLKSNGIQHMVHYMSCERFYEDETTLEIEFFTDLLSWDCFNIQYFFQNSSFKYKDLIFEVAFIELDVEKYAYFKFEKGKELTVRNGTINKIDYRVKYCGYTLPMALNASLGYNVIEQLEGELKDKDFHTAVQSIWDISELPKLMRKHKVSLDQLLSLKRFADAII